MLKATGYRLLASGQAECFVLNSRNLSKALITYFAVSYALQKSERSYLSLQKMDLIQGPKAFPANLVTRDDFAPGQLNVEQVLHLLRDGHVALRRGHGGGGVDVVEGHGPHLLS